MTTPAHGHASTPAILLLGVPPSILCGIDLLSFTTSPKFYGIKDLPPGFHFLFSSETSSLSLRDGFWFQVPQPTPTAPSPLVVRKWDTRQGCLVEAEDVESYRPVLNELWERGLTPYRQSAEKGIVGSGDWEALTEHVTPGILEHLTQSKGWSLTSASCASVDHDHIPGLNDEEMGFKERELGVLGIVLERPWPKGAVGRERTEAVLDGSWALKEVVKKWQAMDGEWGHTILGQMEACFVMVLTLANYSCVEEWKRCLGLVLKCNSAVREEGKFFAQFLALLNRQIRRCEDVDGGLFDMNEASSLLKLRLRDFRRTIDRSLGNEEGEDVKEEMAELETTLRKMFGWELSEDFVRKGTLELEDGETIEMEISSMEEEDESGEYAPVVVDLDNG